MDDIVEPESRVAAGWVEAYSIDAEIGAIPDYGQPNILGECRIDGPSVVGLARILQGTVEGFWERHDNGDELLLLIEGRLTIHVRSPGGGTETRELRPGDLVLVPRGAAHSLTLHTPEVQLLFMMPREGNTAWSDEADPQAA